MPHVEGSVEISAPRRVVWTLLSNVERYPEWKPSAQEVVLVSDGELGVGSVYTETDWLNGNKSTTEWTITSFDPPSRQTHVGRERNMDLELTWTLVEIGPGSTRAEYAMDFQVRPRVVGAVFEPLFATRMMRWQMKRVGRDVKRLAEQDAQE